MLEQKVYLLTTDVETERSIESTDCELFYLKNEYY